MEGQSWLLWLEVIGLVLMPVLTLLGSAGVAVLWRMRQELTTLTVKMEAIARQQEEIDQLWSLVRELQLELNGLGTGGTNGKAKR